ncbi:MAG: PEGA domain-containing protein [Deltaproteobacteria bacterium]
MVRHALPLRILALIGGIAIAAPAWAQDGDAPAEDEPTAETTATSTSTEVAKLYAEAAREYYKAGRYVEALEQFQKAYAIKETPALTYNIGRCHERLSQWKEAIEWYEKYVTLAKNPRDKAEALEKIEFLKSKLAPEELGPDAQYKARLEAGRSAYSKGDYEAAIEEFKAAFDLKATTGPLYNIGKAYEKMGRYEEAIDYFTQYLELDPNATDRADVEELIRRLKKSIKSRFQELYVKSDPTGADIYLDDRNTGLQGQTPFRFKVTPGPHVLYIDLNGYEPIKREFVMPDDKPLELDFKMKKLENVGFLDIQVSEDGARIFVDGAIIGLSPYKQKKAVEAGEHQVQVELLGYDRWSGKVTVLRDQTLPVNVELKEYDAPVEDSTLSSWGRNLMLIGIIGGTLGFVGPFAYQKLILRRPYYDQLGPSQVTGMPFYRGPLDETDPNRPENGELETLRLTQLISLIAGGVFVAGGLSFYMYKWLRTVPPKPVTSGLPEGDAPWVTIESVGVVPTQDGGQFGIVGRF